jgi:hypothetical protein
MPRAAEMGEAARRAAWDALWRILLRPRDVDREKETGGDHPPVSGVVGGDQDVRDPGPSS